MRVNNNLDYNKVGLDQNLLLKKPAKDIVKKRWVREDEWHIQFFHSNFVKVIVHNKKLVAIPRVIRLSNHSSAYICNSILKRKHNPKSEFLAL